MYHLAQFFGVEVFGEGRRTDQIAEHQGQLASFSVMGLPLNRGVIVRGMWGRGLWRGCLYELCPTFHTEYGFFDGVGTTIGAFSFEFGAALHAEIRLGWIVVLTLWTLHDGPPLAKWGRVLTILVGDEQATFRPTDIKMGSLHVLG